MGHFLKVLAVVICEKGGFSIGRRERQRRIQNWGQRGRRQERSYAA